MPKHIHIHVADAGPGEYPGLDLLKGRAHQLATNIKRLLAEAKQAGGKRWYDLYYNEVKSEIQKGLE